MREAAAASPGGRHEVITLHSETATPRRRTLSASFVRERTPIGELPPAHRQRMKNEGKARARALDRLDPVKHEQYLKAERARKRDAARGKHVVRRVCKSGVASCSNVDSAELPSPPWKQQARQRVAAELQAYGAAERRARGVWQAVPRDARCSCPRCALRIMCDVCSAHQVWRNTDPAHWQMSDSTSLS